jgi:hypothetical protein
MEALRLTTMYDPLGLEFAPASSDFKMLNEMSLSSNQ